MTREQDIKRWLENKVDEQAEQIKQLEADNFTRASPERNVMSEEIEKAKIIDELYCEECCSFDCDCRLNKQIRQLQAELADLNRRRNDLIDEYSILRAENKKLKKALKSIFSICDCLTSDIEIRVRNITKQALKGK